MLDTPIATPAVAPRDLADGLFAQSEDTTLVTLLLAPSARWVVEYYPVQAVRPKRGGAVEVDLQVADRRWLRRLLLRLAPHATVLRAPGVRRGLHSRRTGGAGPVFLTATYDEHIDRTVRTP